MGEVEHGEKPKVWVGTEMRGVDPGEEHPERSC